MDARITNRLLIKTSYHISEESLDSEMTRMTEQSLRMYQ